MTSAREKWIAIVAGLAVGVFLLNWMIVSPLMESRDELAAKRQLLETQLEDAQRLVARNQKDSRAFRRRHAAGLAGDASATESLLLNDLRSWSQEAGLTLSSVRPDRTTTPGGLHEIAFEASGDGSMKALAAFLYRLEVAEIPLHVRELQLSTRGENSDDLMVDLHVSTLWEPKPTAAPPASTTPLAERGGP